MHGEYFCGPERASLFDRFGEIRPYAVNTSWYLFVRIYVRTNGFESQWGIVLEYVRR